MSDFKVPVVPPYSRDDLISQAAAFRKKWCKNASIIGPTAVDYLFEIIIPRHYGIKTEYIDFDECGYGMETLGYTDAEKMESYVSSRLIDATDVSGIRLCRSTTGHEIGHCVLHVPYLAGFISRARGKGVELFRANRKDIPAYLDPEWQAWEFSDELLMPSDQLRFLVGEGASIAELANTFNVNPAYVQTRLEKLKIKLPQRGRLRELF